MISDNDIDAALNYLATSAEDAANARANAIYTSDMVDHVEGVLMRDKYGDEPVTVRKNIARADERYKQALQEKRDAAQAWEVFKARRERASMTIEVWRTRSANQRTSNV